MTEIRAQETDPRERDPSARTEPVLIDPATSPIEIAADTFGHILPDTSGRLVRRRARPVSTMIVTAVTLASVGLIVAWFGPWGGIFGIAGGIIGVVSHVRERSRWSWCLASYVISATAILFSAYWVWWILDALSRITAEA